MIPTSSSMRTRSPVAARLGLSVVTALILTVGAVRPARAQTPASSSSAQASSAQAADTSWFDQYHTAPQDTLAPAAYDGWKQFETNCSRCHGENAQGTSFAPSLVQALGAGSAVPTQQAFLSIACSGIPDKGMPSWCALGLGTDQLQTIYLYLKGRADGSIGPGRPAVRQDSTSAGR
jgi:mono/diheme cytochrome c family protein